ncbi:MAG: hypothetical protein RIR40_349, partial [Actinomycetota bacterium]
KAEEITSFDTETLLKLAPSDH